MSELVQLGKLLVHQGFITEEQLDKALEIHRETDAPLGRILVDEKMLSESQLVSLLAAQLNMEYVDLEAVTIDPAAASVIPTHLARRFTAIPIAFEDGRLVVAMADPANVVAMDDLRSVAGVNIRPVVATRGAIEAAIERNAKLETDVEDLGSLVAEEQGDSDLEELKDLTEEAPIVKLVNGIIANALTDRASDIHIEPTETEVKVRYRVDGVLKDAMTTDRRVKAGLVSRLKIMASMDIAERRKPQDGRLSVKVSGRNVDLRVATLPVVHGEKVVMRILDNSTALLRLEDLGFLDASMERYEKAYTLPYGTILVTGPTGSGKSTTLYSTLNQITDPTKNVITVEDPVEYRIPGINQVQVNKKAGLTFEAALRSILRSDPDVVLIGEIRDHETAVIAMEAALTGHLVLSTLHTNDSTSTPTRLVEMGLEPYLVSSALDCVVAQRLARRLCEHCKEAYQPTQAELEAANWDVELPEKLYRPVGCGKCSSTGYRGRLALHEVLMITEELSTLISGRAGSEELRSVAIDQGMLTLRQAGLMQATKGSTSVAEVFRVVA
ncbi:MAG: ATPase, T2SS/T4P/T4SS family [Actinomycetota bacterium]